MCQKPTPAPDPVYPIIVLVEGPITGNVQNFLDFRVSAFIENTGTYQMVVDVFDFTANAWSNAVSTTLLQNCNKTVDVYITSNFGRYKDANGRAKSRIRVGPVVPLPFPINYRLDIDQARWYYPVL